MDLIGIESMTSFIPWKATLSVRLSAIPLGEYLSDGITCLQGFHTKDRTFILIGPPHSAR